MRERERERWLEKVRFWQLPISCLIFHQDLVDNPQYTLIIEKGRFAEKYFSSSDPVKNTEAAILWDRIVAQPTSMESDMNLIEKELLNNQKSIFFGPVLGTRLRFKSIPCYIEVSSGSLYKVTTKQKRFDIWRHS